MTIKTGVLAVTDGMIAWVEVFEENTHQVLYEPTEADIAKMCEEHNFDTEHTLQIIRDRALGIHGFVFIGDRYREHLESL